MPEAIQLAAQAVLAKWFSLLTDIELADRDKYITKTEVQNCERYPSGKTHICELLFVFDAI